MIYFLILIYKIFITWSFRFCTEPMKNFDSDSLYCSDDSFFDCESGCESDCVLDCKPYDFEKLSKRKEK
jgi:hypothetical protein